MASGKQVTKASLNFIVKACWTLVRHRLAPTVNDNTLSTDREALIVCIMSRYAINILRVIAKEIRDRAMGLSTTISFLNLVYRLYLEAGLKA